MEKCDECVSAVKEGGGSGKWNTEMSLLCVVDVIWMLLQAIQTVTNS